VGKKEKKKVGRPALKKGEARVFLSTRVKQTTRDKLDEMKADHDGSLGKTLDFLSENFEK